MYIRIIILIMRFLRISMLMVLMIDISAFDNCQCHWNSTRAFYLPWLWNRPKIIITLPNNHLNLFQLRAYPHIFGCKRLLLAFVTWIENNLKFKNIAGSTLSINIMAPTDCEATIYMQKIFPNPSGLPCILSILV